MLDIQCLSAGNSLVSFIVVRSNSQIQFNVIDSKGIW